MYTLDSIAGSRRWQVSRMELLTPEYKTRLNNEPDKRKWYNMMTGLVAASALRQLKEQMPSLLVSSPSLTVEDDEDGKPWVVFVADATYLASEWREVSGGSR